jgi:hypothetical protein
MEPATSYFDREIIPLWESIKNFIESCQLNEGQKSACLDVENEIWITYTGTSGKPNKYIFIITKQHFGVLAMIRVEQSSKNVAVWDALRPHHAAWAEPLGAKELFRVSPGLFNIEFTLKERPHIWYKKIYDSWILSEEKDPLSGAYLPLTPIKIGARRRTRRNRKTKSRSKSYSRRR